MSLLQEDGDDYHDVLTGFSQLFGELLDRRILVDTDFSLTLVLHV